MVERNGADFPLVDWNTTILTCEVYQFMNSEPYDYDLERMTSPLLGIMTSF